jgi:hypothetical protein
MVTRISYYFLGDFFFQKKREERSSDFDFDQKEGLIRESLSCPELDPRTYSEVEI